jgi:tRNA U34 2-thiouridine synthase MnmA/TrmU
MSRRKAAGFISGGLDSLIATGLMKKQDLDIILVHVINGFGQRTMQARTDITIPEQQWKNARQKELEESFGLPVEIVDISEEFLRTLLSPRYGYGKNVNPCIDCKIDFFSIGADMIEAGRADFVFTGEVLGQRPMSQNKGMMKVIEKRSGLEGLILRPLSGRIMEETIPEKRGWVDRNLLEDIQGRSRRRQIALAEELGIEAYPSPAGGCLLTDVNFATRFRDLVSFAGAGNITVRDTVTLSVGRHFRTSENSRVVAGRNEEENNYLAEVYRNNWILRAADVTGPDVVLFGGGSEEELKKAASITARYCNDKGSPVVRIKAAREGEEIILNVPPAGNGLLSEWRV